MYSPRQLHSPFCRYFVQTVLRISFLLLTALGWCGTAQFKHMVNATSEDLEVGDVERPTGKVTGIKSGGHELCW
jgi:hypothetical protein